MRQQNRKKDNLLYNSFVMESVVSAEDVRACNHHVVVGAIQIPPYQHLTVNFLLHLRNGGIQIRQVCFPSTAWKASSAKDWIMVMLRATGQVASVTLRPLR